ncbi:hypothetical protein BH10PLA1_BH10PLA1_04040 [soil metagenome]
MHDSGTSNNAAASDNLYKAIVDSANYVIVATDATGNITLFNHAAERLFGYTAAEAMGQRTDFLHAPPEVHAQAIVDGLIAPPPIDLFSEDASLFQKVEYERICITKDGRQIPTLSSVSAMRGPNGQVTGYLGIATDLTTRKAAEEQSRMQSAFRQAIEASAPIAIAISDLAGVQTYVNPASCKLTGFSEEELLGCGLPRPYWNPADDMHRASITSKVLAKPDAPANFEMLLRHKDGRSINTYCYISPVMAQPRRMTGWLAVYFDITERKRIENDLHESEARFRSAFDSSASGMSLVHPDGRWFLVNRAQCEITGYTAEELLKTTFQAMTHPDDLNNDLEHATQLLSGEILSYHMEKRYIHKTGRIVWIHLTVSLVRDHLQQPLYFVSQIQDITERKRTDEQLLRAKEAAEAANRAKNAFLANMSHEIRTPLNAISGFADVLESGDLPESDRREFAQTIRRNSEHLLRVLDDILDVSKIEAGKMAIELVPIALRPLLKDVATMLRARAEAKGLKLLTTIPATLPAAVVTDPTRLRQILLNLIGNAVKYTAFGTVTMTASVENETVLRIDVIDTGIGMSAEELKVIFEPFTQVDASHSRRFGGVGLGLAISRRLAALLDATIAVQSEARRGSTFTLRLPIKLPSNDVESTNGVVPMHVRAARVLVVDDSLDSQRLLQFLLTRQKMKVELADNGEAAICAVDEAARQGKPIELIFMDMQMPVLDGYTATPRLRKAGFTSPIVALTANAMTADRDRCLEIGCDEFLSKPVQPQALQRIILKYFTAQ